MLTLEQFAGFDWDEGNRDKNQERHGVSDSECEQVFFNQPLFVFADTEHSEEEQRYYVLGRTDRGRSDPARIRGAPQETLPQSLCV